MYFNPPSEQTDQLKKMYIQNHDNNTAQIVLENGLPEFKIQHHSGSSIQNTYVLRNDGFYIRDTNNTNKLSVQIDTGELETNKIKANTEIQVGSGDNNKWTSSEIKVDGDLRCKHITNINNDNNLYDIENKNFILEAHKRNAIVGVQGGYTGGTRIWANALHQTNGRIYKESSGSDHAKQKQLQATPDGKYIFVLPYVPGAVANNHVSGVL
jgi:hypothetical protein